MGTRLLVLSVMLAISSRAEAAGYWKLAESKKVINNFNKQFDTWYYGSTALASGSMSYFTSCKGVKPPSHYQRIATWTPPPGELHPGTALSMTLTVRNGKTQTRFNEDNVLTASFRNYTGTLGGPGRVDLGVVKMESKAGTGASRTITGKANVPAGSYGRDAKMQIVVSSGGLGSHGTEMGIVYIYKWVEAKAK